jgi:hypothetical protein
MTSKTFSALVLAGIAGLGFVASAHAGQGLPGSLLVFPTFDNTRGGLTLITVTNTNDDPTNANAQINVEFVYINGTNCEEFNRTRTLTPDDEISVLASIDNPNQHKGYCYVFAKSKTTGAAIKFDHLIGTELVIEGGTAGQGNNGENDYTLNPWVFKAGAALAEGANTDVNHNNLHDLDGIEYEPAPDKLDFPHFIGEGGPLNAYTELVLINLTGGAQFQAVVDFLVYNDNEEVFSAQYQFQCWSKAFLDDISSVFENDFLLSTNHASNEVPGTTPTTFNETGWYRVNGDTAFSTAAQFSDPAILGAQIEAIHFDQGGAILPFTEGTQTNGSLLSHNLLGT